MATSSLSKLFKWLVQPRHTRRYLLQNLYYSTEKSEGETKEPKTDEKEGDGIHDPHLPPWPDGVNPHTGERGGPRGPEPTRYGDWERKGRVSDF